jgi:hypothetical protein
VAPDSVHVNLSSEGTAALEAEFAALERAEMEANRLGGPDAGQLQQRRDAVVQKLKTMDSRVRMQERSQAAAGANLSGSPIYDYRTGPDGRRYAVAGEVAIAVRAGATPEATIGRARSARSVALGSARPSLGERAAAESARRLEQLARHEMSEATQRAQVDRDAMVAEQRREVYLREALGLAPAESVPFEPPRQVDVNTEQVRAEVLRLASPDERAAISFAGAGSLERLIA